MTWVRSTGPRALLVAAKPRSTLLAGRFARATAGNAAVEFAVVAPVLALLFVGTVDLGMLVKDAASLDGAVRAAAQYARSSPCDLSTTCDASVGWTPDPAITTILTGYTTFGSRTVTPAYTKSGVTYPFCECPDGTGITCNGSCTSSPATRATTTSW